MASYLTIPGIPGDSLADRHAGAIEVDRWSLGCSQVGDGVATGSARAGRVRFSDLQLTCAGSSASPLLLQACVAGKAVPEVVLACDQADAAAGGSGTELRLADVSITDYTASDDGTGPRDDFRLRFGRVSFSVAAQRPDGAATQPVSATVTAQAPAAATPPSTTPWRHREVVQHR